MVGRSGSPAWTGKHVYALDPTRNQIVHESAARIEMLMLGGEEAFLNPAAAEEGWWWVRMFTASSGDSASNASGSEHRERGPDFEGMNLDEIAAFQGDHYRFGWIERYEPAVLAEVNAPRDPPLPPGHGRDRLEEARQYRMLDDPDWKPLTSRVGKQLRAGAAEACGGAELVAELAPARD